jgi:hypothetical protein
MAAIDGSAGRVLRRLDDLWHPIGDLNDIIDSARFALIDSGYYNVVILSCEEPKMGISYTSTVDDTV